jgi:hypothetical protein
VDNKNRDFFWPSYVDLLTALFAIVLVLFVLTLFNLTNKNTELKNLVELKEKEAEILNKVKSNLKLFEKEPGIFIYDTSFNRIQLAFQIQYKRGLRYFNINDKDIEDDFVTTKAQLSLLGSKLKSIIDTLQSQKTKDAAMKDISYLMVISGSASNLPGDNENDNYLLSYKRALSLYKFWKNELNIDFDAITYHNIIELQISGVGFGGVGRFNTPYSQNNLIEEEKNQRFIIHIAPKIGK